MELISPPYRRHTRAFPETGWRLVCCCTRRHKKGAMVEAAACILKHARRLFTHRAGAGSCSDRAAARYRSTAAVRSSRPHRGGGSSITYCGGSYPGSHDGNLRKPSARPHRRLCQPQHSSARIHNKFMVRQRAGTFKGLADRPSTRFHVLARGVFAWSLQRLASPEQRLRHSDSGHLSSGPCAHHAVTRAEAALPKSSSLRTQKPGRRGLRYCRTSSAPQASCSIP